MNEKLISGLHESRGKQSRTQIGFTHHFTLDCVFPQPTRSGCKEKSDLMSEGGKKKQEVPLPCHLVKRDLGKQEHAPIHVGANKKHQRYFILSYLILSHGHLHYCVICIC